MNGITKQYQNNSGSYNSCTYQLYVSLTTTATTMAIAPIVIVSRLFILNR